MNKAQTQKYIFSLEDISIGIKGEIPLRVSLKVKSGDYIIIKGRNSSGKSYCPFSINQSLNSSS